jgi:hypothetical protein
MILNGWLISWSILPPTDQGIFGQTVVQHAQSRACGIELQTATRLFLRQRRRRSGPWCGAQSRSGGGVGTAYTHYDVNRIEKRLFPPETDRHQRNMKSGRCENLFISTMHVPREAGERRSLQSASCCCYILWRFAALEKRKKWQRGLCTLREPPAKPETTPPVCIFFWSLDKLGFLSLHITARRNSLSSGGMQENRKILHADN